jgi:hypothetical protein
MCRLAKHLKIGRHVVCLTTLILGLSACHSLHFFGKSTQGVPNGKHLLNDEKVVVNGDALKEEELISALRQHPNSETARIKWRLRVFYMVDSARVEKRRYHQFSKLRKINKRRIERENKINDRRIARAKRKGETTYLPKRIPLKDTTGVDPKLLERIKYKKGESPVLADTFLLAKSREQLQTYLRSKGYFYSEVDASFDTICKMKNGQSIDLKKVNAMYTIQTGKRYIIDTVLIESDNAIVTNRFMRYLKKEDKFGLNASLRKALVDKQPVQIAFDAAQLDAYRFELAKYMRDGAVFGFSEANVLYAADTSKSDMTMRLTIQFTNRLVQKEASVDSLIEVKFKESLVESVYFHICDTTWFEGDFSAALREAGIFRENTTFVPTLDTFVFKELLKRVEDKSASEKTFFKSVEKNLFGKFKDSIAIDPFRIATFCYNGQMFVDPGLLESQNYLENTNYYKDYYFDRTYTRLAQLGLFALIRPEIIERVPGSGRLEVHYFLIPAKKKSIMIAPRAVYSNGFMGVNASLNFTNKNLWRSGTNMTLSLSGGFEGNPSVLEDSTGTDVFRLNTVEVGPSVKFDIPGLFPLSVTKLGKRQRPRTTISLAYNYQDRQDFKRGILQFNYLYNFYVGDGKTQVVTFGFPGLSVLKFVNFNPSELFDQKISELNDLFMRNTYSSQFIWEDFRVAYEYNNLEKEDRPKNLLVTINASFNTAGTILGLVTKNQEANINGQKELFGVPFSQFSLLDSKLIANLSIKKNVSLAFRTLAGIGIPGRNTSTSLPYDYSFFGGGSNDIRGWEARTLGPGSYGYLLDSNSVKTQIGDIRLGASLELRFGTGGFFNHAIFMDAGNIWTMKEDALRPGGQFTKNWYKEIALAAGYGLRLDFDFFIFRFDIGFPLFNPTLPDGSRWYFESTEAYYDEAELIYGSEYNTILQPYQKRFRRPTFNIGIGLPF